MRTYLTVVVWTASITLVPLLAAQSGANPVSEGQSPEKRAPTAKIASEPSPRPPLRAAKAFEASSPGASVAEILGQNFTLDAGKSTRIFAKSDFSGASRASFAVYADSKVNISKIQILVWWSLPAADFYAVQDVINASNFPYTNTGGGNVPVYGPQLFVDVINNGDSAVTLQQLTVYAASH